MAVAGADFIFKYIIIGDMGVGKSCLLHQFQEHKFLAESNHTIGVEFGTKIVNVDGKQIKLQIWDTAGQERFRSVTRSYYRGAACAILVFDITRRSSFTNLQTWLTDARKLVNDYTVFVLVGNKLDLKVKREVSFEEADKFAHDHKLIYIEASAKTGEKVEEVFLETARDILKNIDTGKLDVNATETTGVQVINNAPVNLGGSSSGRSGCKC